MNKGDIFDRDTQIQALLKRITAFKDGYRQNIAIIGDEAIGKTFIIFKLLNIYSDPKIITAYLEIRPEPFNSLIRRFIGVLLYNFMSNSGLELKEDLDFLLNKSRQFIPKTVNKADYILSSLKRSKKNNLFFDLLSLAESIYEESGKKTIFIFDEFHNLENVGIRNLYKEWTKLLVTNKNTMHIIISSSKFRAKKIISNNLSLLFGNFETITVEPFDALSSDIYLEKKLNDYKINKSIRDFIVHFTGGYPFYLDVLSSAIKNSAHEDIIKILEDFLFQPSGILNQKFSNYLKRFIDTDNCQQYISILHTISSGHNKIKDIAHLLHKQRKEILARIDYLVEFDVITRSGDFLTINDRVFNFWLKYVYQGKISSLTFDAKNQREVFINNIKCMIDDFVKNTKKSIPERVSELLHLFEDEMVQIETKKIRLDRFKEIKPLELNIRGIRNGLIGRSYEGIWVVAFKQDALTEEDIAEFSKECKKFRNKLQRKIIVTLRDVDSNARLRALEEKVLTWDINHLNYIFDLFYKPRVTA
ncbi:MAG: hypothetical protein C4533_03200 [Candidatus Omnitrophota bacterium]|jgi:hypothetical protein|nr:MAG: hypothetical protein C4533_03200 [Candidatus Omnitrophota bacterium]